MPEKTINGDTLRNLRLKAGMTVPGLSSQSTYIGKGGKVGHVSSATILSYESGRRRQASETTLLGLAKGLGLDIFELEKILTQGVEHVVESKAETPESGRE